MNAVIAQPYTKLAIPEIDGWVQCDYEDGGCRVFDTTSRKCSKALLDCVTPDFAREFTALFNSTKTIKLDLIFNDSEVLKYDVGSHFTSHVDRIRGAGHIGTLLIVISSSDLDGGVLTIKNMPVQRAEKSYMVYIPLGVHHSVSIVTKGSRYVYKTSVFSTNLPPNSKINILHYRDVEINPYTRIIASTGNRLPLQEELSGRFPDNAIHKAMNNPSQLKRD
jgi:hypothetical protein